MAKEVKNQKWKYKFEDNNHAPRAQSRNKYGAWTADEHQIQIVLI
jgi:hypothetical protein